MVTTGDTKTASTAHAVKTASLVESGKGKPVFQRPHPNDQADLDLLVTEGRGSEDTLERMPYVANHLDFLANREDLYIVRPQAAPKCPPSEQPPQAHQEADEGVWIADDAAAAEPARSFLYHSYWKGPMTFRVELFIKGYLMTQNLALSQLHIWVDEISDDSPTAADMTSHALFQQFNPLVASGAIAVHPWKLPARIPVRADLNHRDGRDYYRKPKPHLGPGVTPVADGVFRDDKTGQLYLDFYVAPETRVSPVAMSDVFRFIMLHERGGVYLDMDVLLLRDLRPLMVPGVPFAERWGCHDGEGDYNTAVLFLGEPGNDLATFFLRMGLRLGHNFHPQVMGDFARLHGRHRELRKLETAAFDPVWCEISTKRLGKAMTPDFGGFEEFFEDREKDREVLAGAAGVKGSGEDALEGLTAGQRVGATFFKGAFAYHIHNLWKRVPDRGSYLWHFTQWQNRFFKGEEVNIYGEKWQGPALEDYKF